MRTFNLTLFKLIFVVFSIVVMIGILLNGIPTFFWQDDFSLYVGLQDKNIFQFSKEAYFNWDGRRVTPTSILRTLLLKNTTSAFTTTFWALSFIVASFFTLKSIGVKGKNHIISTGLIAAALIILFKPHASQTIYWATGGVYIFNLLLATIWLWLYSSDGQKKFLYPFTFLMGLTTQNLTVALILIVLFDFLITKIRSGYWKKELIFLFLFFLPGMVIISIAPGNWNRTNDYSFFNTDILTILGQTGELYLRAFKISRIAIPLAAISALFLYSKNSTSTHFVDFLKYLFAALITLSPYIVLPPELSSAFRNYIYFQFFFFLSLVYLFFLIIKYIENHFTNFFSKFYEYASLSLSGALLVFASVIIFYNLNNGIEIKQKVKEREEYILNSCEPNITIPKIEISWSYGTYMHTFRDLNNSKKSFGNKDAATYYNKESIIAIDENNNNQ